MVNRRQFLCTAAAGTAILARIPSAHAATYDLIIKGGRVIDPSLGINAIGDVAIAGGRIAAVEPNIASDATDTIDARGKLVVPGLIDIHTHTARDKNDAPVCLADGVTAMVDAGSRGADLIDDGVAVAKASPNQLRLLINVSRRGSLPVMTLDLADVPLARAAIARHRDTIVGIKARMEKKAWGGPDGDLAALAHAQAMAEGFNLPVMIHLGQPDASLPKILALLKRGDIVTHMYAPAPNGILDDNGRLLPEVLAARRRGVWFDVGNGTTGHITWEQAERAIKQGFLPNTISTDWTPAGRVGGVVDLPNVMSKFLLLGMSLDHVIACVTVNAARVFEAFHDRGTLNVGAPADVAVLELREGAFEFVDNFQGKRTGRQRLFPSMTVLGGKRVPPRA
jgi:dihydroorotase